MSHKIGTITALAGVLATLGYPVTNETEDTVHTQVGKFDVVLTLNEEFLSITCPISRLSQINEDKWDSFAFSALSANNRIIPFAFAIIEEESNEDSIITLTDSIPMGDISDGEVRSMLDSLRAALLNVGDVLRVGYTEPVSA